MSRDRLSVVLLSCILVMAGCDKARPIPASPVAPESAIAPTVPSGPPMANWDANMTVLSVSVSGNQDACGPGPSVGQAQTGVLWSIAIEGNSISLDENVAGWPTDDSLYTGTLNGLQFSATLTAPAADPRFCSITATLSGSFNGDFSRFDATETVMAGRPGGERTTQMQWVGLRR